MKTQRKNKFLIILILSALFSNFAHGNSDNGEEQTPEEIINELDPEKLRIHEEGTEVEMSQEQMDEILPWVNDTKYNMELALKEYSERGTRAEKLAGLKAAIRVAVQDSKKYSHVFMRYVLNRSIKILGIMEKEANESDIGVIDAKIRILRESMRLAIELYPQSLNQISQQDFTMPSIDTQFAKFGYRYFLFLQGLNRSIIDASAQYSIQRTALAYLQLDLYRDLNNKAYAPQIKRIYNRLEILPETPSEDDRKSIRRLFELRALFDSLALNQRIALN